MFTKAKSQYIALYQTDNQVKVGYQVYEKNQLLVNQNSTVLSSKEVLPKELELIFQTKIAEVKESYICSLLSFGNEKLLETSEPFNTESFSHIQLSDDYKIIVPNESVENLRIFFAHAGIDFIFSPVQILYQFYLDTPTLKTLNILLYDDKFYCLYIDSNSKISYFGETLSKFVDISKSEFYEDDIKQQKLYDEIYYLEVMEKITKFLESNQLDVSNIVIYYDIKQLSPIDLQNLKNHFLVDISYKKANILEALLNFGQNPAKYRSFITPRIKQKQNIYIISVAGVLLSIAMIFGVTHYFNDSNEEPLPTRPAAPKINYISAVLPNHIIFNEKLLKEITFLFESIPQSSTLNSVMIDQNSSTLSCNFAEKNQSQKEMKSKLALFYKDTKITFKKYKPPFEAIISNSTKLDNEISPQLATKMYKYEKKFSQDEALALFKSYVPHTSEILFDSELNSNGIKSYHYTLKYSSTSPKEFFDFLEALNRLNHSIYLAIPTQFIKIENGIQIETTIVFNQKL